MLLKKLNPLKVTILMTDLLNLTIKQYLKKCLPPTTQTTFIPTQHSQYDCASYIYFIVLIKI